MRTVYIVDDDHGVCDALSDLLRTQGIRTLSFVSSREFLENIHPVTEPTVVVLDLRMPEKSGLEVQQVLKDRKISCPLIFLTGHANVETAVSGLRSGAVDYLLKPVSPDTLLSSINRALEISEKYIKDSERGRSLEKRFSSLTPREMEICKYICNGYTAKMVGRVLGISPRTAEIHRSRIIHKLSAENSADLISLGIAYGLRDDSGASI